MVKKLRNGNLLVPQRAEDANGNTGDGWVEIGPSHPDYRKYLKEALRLERVLGKPKDAK